MDFWGSMAKAAERAKDVGRMVSQKGLELAETATEEANKKLKDLGLHEKVGAGGPTAPPPSVEELEYYGITAEFQEFIRTLNYSTFRDFPAEHLVPLQAGAPAAPDAPQVLNPWQAQHAKLVCQVVKEVDELRFVLCPRYMTDEHFWHVYFTLVKKYLPEKAFTFSPDQDTLPAFSAAPGSSGGGNDLSLLSSLGSQLTKLGSKLQQSGRSLAGAGEPASAAAQAGAGSSGTGTSSGAATAGGGAAAGAAAAGSGGAPAAAAPSPKEDCALEADPDLEAYLQVAISEVRQGGEGGGSEEYEVAEGEGEEEEDLDLDSYINELSAEMEAAEQEEKDKEGA